MSICSFIRLGICLAASVDPLAVSAEYPISRHRESFVSGGERIGVEIYAPKVVGRFPGVLILHSSAGTVIGKRTLQQFARTLAAQGTVTFFVRYFDRTGTLWASDEDIAKLSPLWIDTVKDAVDFAAVHPRVRSSAMGIFGYSLGAYLAVAESSRDRRIDAIVEVAGGIFERFHFRMQRLPPTLILHGREDRRVPVGRAFELAKAARDLGMPPVVKIYAGEGHILSRGAIADATRSALQFFAKHLGLG